MRNESYTTGFLICLSALELNQYSLLSQIDVELYAPPVRLFNDNDDDDDDTTMRYRRTNSHPNISISPPTNQSMVIMTNLDIRENLNDIDGKSINVIPTFRKIKSLPELHSSKIPVNNNNNNNNNSDLANLPRQRSKTFGAVHKINKFQNERIANKSTKNDITAMKKEATTTTTTTTTTKKSDNSNLQNSLNPTLDSDFLMLIPSKESQSCASSMLSSTHSSSNSSYTAARKIQIINCDDIKIWTDQNFENDDKHQRKKFKSQNNTTPPCDIPQNNKNTSPIQSFLSNLFGTPPASSSWSQHTNSSASSLHDVTVCVAQPNDYHHINNPTNTQYYNINHSDYIEPVTTTIASVFDSFMPVYGKKVRSHNSESLFETGISYLDYSQPQSSSSNSNAVAAVAITTAENVNADNEIISTAVSKNCESLTAFLKMSKLSRNNTALEKENAHFRISEAIISAVEHIKWTKLQAGQTNSTKSNVQEAEEHIPFAEVNGVEEFADQHSAEVVGLTLLSKFNDKQLPKVSELKWLVSEEDAPQKLLPLPDNISNNPDDHFVPSLTRGTRYWAPPRPQIIFTDHPHPNRKQLVQKQNNRCAGCGMVVSAQYVHSFRYCTYLGKYHCSGCHRNQMSSTPAKILQNWDFKCYPVSVFAYRLLEQMYTCPLFHVPDLNPMLYEKQCTLQKARFKRLQLHYVRDFINSCRYATREQQYFDNVPTYLTAEPDLWSMSDLTDASNKIMQRFIDDLIERCENHIFHCVLCTARGFLCEYCKKNEIIYPWQKRVHRCDKCGACFHRKCWTSGMSAKCLRCQRLQNRKPKEDAKNII